MHKNNFDLLRLLGACMVFVSHTYFVYGLGSPHLLWATGYKSITLGGLGVGIFFAISGYLITQSWCTTPNLRQFIVKRILRIYPALIVCWVFIVVVIGPLATTLEPSVYWSQFYAGLPRFAGNVLLLMNEKLPGVFTHNFIRSNVNGSIWIIKYEVLCYALVAAGVLVYLTVYAGMGLRYLGNAARYGDLSYGIYIYAWPLQQFFSGYFSRKPEFFLHYALITGACTVCMAALSWHLVEKWALKLKPRATTILPPHP